MAQLNYRLEGDRVVATGRVLVAAIDYIPDAINPNFREISDVITKWTSPWLVADHALRRWLADRGAPLINYADMDFMNLCLRIRVMADLSGHDLTYYGLRWAGDPLPVRVKDLAQYVQELRDQDEVA